MTEKNTSGAAEFEAYLSEQALPFQDTLEAIRQIVTSEAPSVEECISYQVPTFKYLGHGLVALGVTKTACSFYTMNPALVKSLKDQLAGIKHSGSTLHFPPGEPVPEAILRQIVRMRMAENEVRAAKKRKK